MNAKKINQSLKNVTRYLGSFNINELNEIKIDSFPLFVIINISRNKKTVPYYISVAVYCKAIFICDSLGYLVKGDKLPYKLINYLDVIFSDREIHITGQLQNSSTNLSAAYSIFFVREMNRSYSFKHFLSYFTCNKYRNDQLVSFLY
jgi:hypothetical protein